MVATRYSVGFDQVARLARENKPKLISGRRGAIHKFRAKFWCRSDADFIDNYTKIWLATITCVSSRYVTTTTHRAGACWNIVCKAIRKDLDRNVSTNSRVR